MGPNKKQAAQAKIEAKKARQAAKQSKAASKRIKKELKETGEEDIESLIVEFQEKEKLRTQVVITSCTQPSARSNFSASCLPNNDILIFGGECCDGEKTVVYNELYRWNVEKNEWKMIESLNTPPPRCSHQAVVFKDKLYVFGGEYATLDQFVHYRDLWILDCKTYVWEEVKYVSGDWPSARSGHRMVLWRNFIVLFGGFFETVREERRWIPVPLKQFALWPKPRSGFLMMVYPQDDSIYVYGGYSKEKSGTRASEGRIHTDMWQLSFKSALRGSQGLEISKIVWQKISNKGNPPTLRCGTSSVTYKNKAIVFGGVHDSEGARHSLISSFYNDLHAFDFERKRWYVLGLKKAKLPGTEKVKKAKKTLKTDTAEENDENDNEASSEEDEDEIETSNVNEENDAEDAKLASGDFFGYIDENGDVVYMKLEDEETEELHSHNTSDVEYAENIEKSYDETMHLDDNINAKSIYELSVDVVNISSMLEDSNLETKDDSFLRHPNIIEVSRLNNDAEESKGSELELTSQNLPTSIIQTFFNDTLLEPISRINACLLVRGCSLYIYGGLTEIGDIEVTLDDCWSLDLNKRDSWKCVLRGHMHQIVWKAEIDDDNSATTGGDEDEDGDDSDDDDDNDDDDEEDDEEDGEEEEVSKEDAKAKVKSSKSKSSLESPSIQEKGATTSSSGHSSRRRDGGSRHGGSRSANSGVKSEIAALNEALFANDVEGTHTPEINETLRAFYSRTSTYWKEAAIQYWNNLPVSPSITSNDISLIDTTDITPNDNSVDDISKKPIKLSDSDSLSDKELKRLAFSLSGDRFEEVAHILAKLAEYQDICGDDNRPAESSRSSKNDIDSRSSKDSKKKDSDRSSASHSSNSMHDQKSSSTKKKR